MFSLRILSRIARLNKSIVKYKIQKACYSSVFTKRSPLFKHSLFAAPKKYFSGLEVQLSQEEAMQMEEYEKIINDLGNKAVQESNYAQTMSKLIDICFIMSKYADYMDGWIHLISYFQSNYSTLNNEDFLKFFQYFNFLRIALDSPDHWKNIIKHFIHNRTDIPSSEFLKAFHVARGNDYLFQDKALLEELFNKLLSFNYSTLEESLSALYIAADFEANPDHQLWSVLGSKIGDNIPFTETTPENDYILGVVGLTYPVSHGNRSFANALSSLKSSFFAQIHRLGINTQILFVNKLVETSQITEQELVTALYPISKNSKFLHPANKSKLSISLLFFASNNIDFTTTLNSIKYSNIEIPSREQIEDFKSGLLSVKSSGFNSINRFCREYEARLNPELASELLNYTQLENYNAKL